MKSKYIFKLSFLLLLSACNSYEAKDHTDHAQVPLAKASLDFNLIQARILKSECIMCHSDASGNAAGVNLETYANVKKFIEDVQQTVVVEKTMPPGKPISNEDQQLLINWISNGAPEKINPSAQAQLTEDVLLAVIQDPGNTAPTESDLLPTYSSILKNILSDKCAKCHDANVASFDAILASKWVVANNLDASPLYTWVKAGKMPRRKKLSQNEIDMIGAWIMDGAKNN